MQRRTFLIGMAATLYSETAMANIVKRFNGEERALVATAPAVASLPSSLVIEPGFYTWQGVTYDCREEGLYRFFLPMQDTQQRIVWQSDVFALMSAIAWICVNGRADESLTVAEMLTRARTSKLRMLCGKQIEFAKAICDSAHIAIENRVARSLTAGTPNNYYDGHVMLEAKVGGAWTLFDIANNQYYENADGVRALRDVLPLSPDIARIRLANNFYSVEPHAPGQFDATMWQSMTMTDPDEFASEIERVLHIPGIDRPTGETWFRLQPVTENRAEWVESLSALFKVKDQEIWDATFYPS
ncbi:MAG: hypothetical protein LAT55_13275 [Opitutales bacterium]|nr:hypothetical protein [Opitutales bacterium]